MAVYYLDVRDLQRDDREEYDGLTRRLARAVVGASDVERVRIRGLSDRLASTDEDAFETLVRAADAEPVGWFEETVEYTESVGDAVLRLFSPALLRVEFVSDSPVFARYDDSQVYFTVSDDDYGDVEDVLGDHARRVTNVSELDVTGAEGGSITRGTPKALMEETPDDDA